VWKIDGKIVGRGRTTTWPLWQGKHQVELTDAAGKLLDALRFEVRGTELKVAALGPVPVSTKDKRTPQRPFINESLSTSSRE
jgi:hypothetical protein